MLPSRVATREYGEEDKNPDPINFTNRPYLSSNPNELIECNDHVPDWLRVLFESSPGSQADGPRPFLTAAPTFHTVAIGLASLQSGSGVPVRNMHFSASI